MTTGSRRPRHPRGPRSPRPAEGGAARAPHRPTSPAGRGGGAVDGAEHTAHANGAAVRGGWPAIRRVSAPWPRFLARGYWPLVAVLGAYCASVFVVPAWAPVPVGDDWVYARSVEILLREGEVRIFDLTVVTLLFQLAWGALFAAVFGPSFSVLRLATIVLVLLSGWAFYGLCRELGISPGRSVLGVAAYLFNPLAFVLSFTFMSDPYFTALLIVATLCYARGLRPGAAGGRAMFLGSVVTALAFLVRQQGALIPFAVVLYLLASRRLRPSRAGLALFARVVAIPAGTTVAYYLWLNFIHGVPYWQRRFFQNVLEAGWGGAGALIARLSFIEAMYLGLFALPIVAGALGRLRGLVRFGAPGSWLLFCAWEAMLVAGLVAFGSEGRWMPYVPQYLAPWGLGPADLLGDFPRLVGSGALVALTVACAAGALVLGLALCRRVGDAPAPDRSAAGLALVVGLWQAVGVLPPSFGFRDWAGSLDRYLLPLLPFAICLGLWALRDVRLALPAAWLVVAAFALFAVAGTRDFLVFQQATWGLARHALELGVPITRLDAGASWDGYHLYEYSRDNGIRAQTPDGPWWPARPWWTGLFGPATDSSYIVAVSPLPEFPVVTRVEYSSWLHREPTYLYLLRRPDVPGPP